MGRDRMQLDRAVEESEDEEAELKEEEDAQQSRSIAKPRRTSGASSNREKDAAKPPLSQKKQLQSVPRKAPPNQNSMTANGKDAQTRLLSAENKDAKKRDSSDKKNVAKPKSNAAQLSTQAKVNASSLTSKALQSRNRAIADLKKAPEVTVAQSRVATLQRAQTPTNNVAQKPKNSFAASAKPKSFVAKRKPIEDIGIAQSKKAKPEQMFAKVFQSVYNQDDIVIIDDTKVEMTVDRWIEKAEQLLDFTTGKLGDDHPLTDEETNDISKVAGYSAMIAKIHDKSAEAGEEPSSQSPIWSTAQSSLQMLHGLQEMNTIVCDILAAIESYQATDNQIMRMLSIYITYQIEQNNRPQVNFDQDLEVMEKLIEKYVANGSLGNIFSEAFPVDNHPLLGGWLELEDVEITKKRGKKDLVEHEESDDADGKYGARLLLLLAYMMVSNVMDDESNNTLIRPAIRVLGCQPEWKKVLRKLGQMLFFISPDPSIAEYEECYKICINQFHFLNSYLLINKGGVKKTQTQKKSQTSPKIQTSRALQRFSVIVMSGFLLNQFQNVPAEHPYSDFEKCKTIQGLIETIIPSKNINDTLHFLGYDIALRNWIQEHTGALQLHDKKPRGKRDGEQLYAQHLQMEENMRNMQNSLETQIQALKDQLHVAQNRIQDLQRQQQSIETMHTWFSLHKCLLQDLLDGPGKKNSDDDSFANDGEDEEKDESSEQDDHKMEEFSDADGNENGQNDEEIQENVDDGNAEAEEEGGVVMLESDYEEEVEEFENPSQ